ncbi:MAG: 3-dehydroquinate synthase [Gammaproteobacteria bacterium]|nr:3-dehydroquinate synthase [Gammaproteobacteria bacterium]MBT8064703.1 3-dehydroquinate synthase [Gammaproteobacteria bacterium]
MKTIDVKLESHDYPVYLGHGLLSDAGLWSRHLGGGQILVVSNETVAPLYLEPLQAALGPHHVKTHIIPDGEQYKTTETWYGVIDRLVEMQARRDATLVALGGGVVGDISGFAAACYMRGIRFIQVPTTLLAQVDASVGGKTAINHVRGKNLVGAFHQPAAVIIDSATLKTLPPREFRAGMAEVIKYGAIRDPSFFDWLEREAPVIADQSPDAIDELIYRSVRNKAEIVSQDEKEAGIRALLNLGHSFGHALEAETAYARFLHGEAVAIGMVCAAVLSESRGLCPPGTADRLSALLESFRLPVRIPADLSLDGLASALQLDKKAVASGLRLVLLTGIGHAVVDDQSEHEAIMAAMKHCMEAS